MTLFILKTSVSSHFLLGDGGTGTNEILHGYIMFCICLNSTVFFVYLKTSKNSKGDGNGGGGEGITTHASCFIFSC